MNAVAALFSGVLLGLGLMLSGMIDPRNVIAFLDVTGRWRPSLLYTMAAAVVVAMPCFFAAHRRTRTFLHTAFDWPGRVRITRELIAGSMIFGVGWGLSGICPGASLVLMTRPHLGVVTLFLGMSVGLLLASRRMAGRKRLQD